MQCLRTSAAEVWRKVFTLAVGTRTFLIFSLFLLGACGGATPDSAPEESLPSSAETSSQGVVPADVPVQEPSAVDPVPFQDLAAADLLNLNQRWTGDYEGLEQRRFLRVLVPFSRTLYYMDGPEQKGIAYEALRELESQLPRIGQSKVTPKIVIIPTRSEE